MGELLTADEAHIPSLSIRFELKRRETIIHYLFFNGNDATWFIQLNWTCTTTSEHLKHVLFQAIKSRAAKLRETLLMNCYKWCNASFSFSNSQCGCYFLWKKGKKHEEQICNSTEQYLILKILTAIMCSRALHQSRYFSGKKIPTSSPSSDKWTTAITCAAHILQMLAV